MKLKQLVSSRFQIVAVMVHDRCPAEDFLINGEDSTSAVRSGLVRMLETAADGGLDNLPNGWVHLANKQRKIYEFIKGPLRLFFFKGKDGQIAVCTTGVRKAGQKADDAEVLRAAKWQDQYYEALKNNALITVVDDGTE